MGSNIHIFVFLFTCFLIKLIYGAPYCAIGDPKFKDDKKGYVFGVPATGTCPKSGKGAKIQYIIPVDNVDLPPEKATGDKNIFSVGLYDPKRFDVGVESIKDFLKKNNVPGYVKFLIVNGKDTDCDK